MELSIALLCPRPPRRVPDVHDLNDVLAYAIKYFVRKADEEFHLHREQAVRCHFPKFARPKCKQESGRLKRVP